MECGVFRIYGPGFIHFFDFGGGLEFEGTGVMFSRIYYTGMTVEERLAAVDEIDMAFLMEEWDLVGDLEMEFEKRQINLFTIYVTANPWEPERLCAFLREKAVAGAKDRGDEAEEDYFTRAWALLEQPELITQTLTMTSPLEVGAVYVDPNDDVVLERLF